VSDHPGENGASESTENNTENNGVANPSATTSQIEDLQKQVEKFRNEYLYLKAEFENYKRNSIKERSDLLKYGSERLAVEILNVLDNFERALAFKVNPDNVATFSKGVEMTAQELKAALSKFGIVEVPAEGAAFDPMLHEALSSEETSQVKEGHVFRVFKKPYKLHEKIIRPGQVVVAKRPTEN
jgi:molecular chaperone GrpE